ncbi:MAG TPA: MotA/TolQ/ExbB proton channel family protein [Pseudomonadales bacterium]
MFELVKSGGWLMLPIVLCSIAAFGICLERLWTLRPGKIAPMGLVGQVWGWIKKNQLDSKKITNLGRHSSLGRILAVGLINSKYGRDIMKESIAETASHEIHKMERFLNTLGTIAAITPLLGLLGTVLGMIRVFTAIVVEGSGNATVLAGGISEALITTAAGLTVGIPALFFHRFFTRRIEEISINMEQQAIKLVDAVHGEREVDLSGVE